MQVRNIHERRISAPVIQVGALIDTLASKNDKLWPIHKWPAMRFDKDLEIGAKGGHGPVRVRRCSSTCPGNENQWLCPFELAAYIPSSA